MQPRTPDIHINHYTPGHPWFYVLGGPVQSLKAIRRSVELSGYRGYRDEIERAARKAEPKRSAALAALRAKIEVEFASDISGYRRAARTLYLYRRRADLAETPECEGVHVAISLKYSHLFNDFAHLIWIDSLEAQQLSLF